MKLPISCVSFVRLTLLASAVGLVAHWPARSAGAAEVKPAPRAAAPALEAKPSDPYFAKFQPVKAPVLAGSVLKPGDRLAICGDSITEQKMYSRIIETYLTVAVPELAISVRQYGWSGETAPGFLSRLTNDCLRFKPTIATTCYGMNDHGYRPYEEAIGQRYRDSTTLIVRAFKSVGARVILGSPGCVGKKPAWSQSREATPEDLNLNLCKLRNIDVEIAQAEKVGFADVFWPMLTAGFVAQQRFGPDYAIAGKDGVHPGWAGQVVMAYAFLHALGLNGEIGAFTVDLKAGKAALSPGHELLAFDKGQLQIKSQRYPFCSGLGELTKDDNLRSGLAWVPFNQELNRLLLLVKNGTANHYKITWGAESQTFSAEVLARGVNLVEAFPANPFSAAFAKVDAAVAAKQAYETRQVKDLFHGPEGHADFNETVDLTEKTRAPFVAAIRAAFVPVVHTLKIEPQ